MSNVETRNVRRGQGGEEEKASNGRKIIMVRRRIVERQEGEQLSNRQAVDSVPRPALTEAASISSLARRQDSSIDSMTEIGSQTITAITQASGSSAIVFDTKPHSEGSVLGLATSAGTSKPSSSSHSSQKSSGSLSPGVQQALIAAGSVGAVVVLVMLLWIVFRIRKRKESRERHSMDSSSKRSEKTAVQYNFSSPSRGVPGWSSPLPSTYENKEILVSETLPLKSPSYTNMGRESPSLYSVQGHSIGYQSPGFNSTYVNSPSTQSPAMTSPGIQTPPSHIGQFPIPPLPTLGRSIASPAKNAYLIPAPLQTYNNNQHSPTGTGPFQFDDPPATTFQPPFPRKPSTCHTIAEQPSADDGGLSVIGEEIEEYFTNSGPNSRQSPKASRTPSTYSLGRRSYRERASLAISIATSVESVPRFRTINSWVNHQSNRLEGRSTPNRSPGSASGGHSHQNSQENLPQVPAIPESTPGYGHVAADMRRMDSTSTATIFRHHPGEKIEMGRGSMIPSDVLDQDLNVM